MKTQKILRSLIAQASVLMVLLIGLCATPSKSSLQDRLPSDNVSLPGVHGATNNTVHAFDRYVIVAPFAPTGDIGDGSDLSKFDNHYLYLFDTKKPENGPRLADLKVCYFPTKVKFDPNTGNVFVRGTEFIDVGGGQFEAREVLVHAHLNLESDGKPAFDTDFAVPIHIPGNGSEYTSDAPIDFALGHNGRILVFTNGSSVFTYDVIAGTIYPIVIADNPNNVITYVDVDEANNTLIFATSQKVEGTEGGPAKFTSELYFYKLEKNGTANQIKHLYPEQFGEGFFLSAGSNAAVSWDPINERPEYGYFVTNDGAVCQIDLRTPDLEGVIERVAVLPEMAQAEGLEPGPVTVRFDRAKRLLTVVKQGTFWNIRRPSFVERGGRIRRPSFSQSEGSAGIALVQFNKKNRVVGQRVFDKVFGKENRISNLVAGRGGLGLIATHSGMIFAVNASGSLDTASVDFIGEIGTRIDRIAYNAGRQNLTAISSYVIDDESQGMLPGSILFARVPLNAD